MNNVSGANPATGKKIKIGTAAIMGNVEWLGHVLESERYNIDLPQPTPIIFDLWTQSWKFDQPKLQRIDLKTENINQRFYTQLISLSNEFQ